MKQKLTAFILGCLFFVATGITVVAAVQTVEEPTAGQRIYIAGNPNLYPIEYYDSKTESYKGILPEIYDRLSENIGMEFSYISAGIENEQSRLAENKQVEMVSAHLKGEVEGLVNDYLFLSYEENGEMVDIYVGFTGLLSDSKATQIEEELAKFSDSEILQMSIAVSKQGQQSGPSYILTALIGIMAVLLVGLIVILIRIQVGAKKKKQNEKTDHLTGIGNEKYFMDCFEHHILVESYSLYYVAYIALEIQKIEKYSGTTEAEEIQRYAANLLTNAAKDTDFVARINDGVFAYAFQCPSEEDAGVLIGELLDRLNGYGERFLEQYRMLFQAGIFHLNTGNIPCETAVFNARQGYYFAVQNKIAYAFCDEKLLSREALQTRLQRKLKDAIKNNEFKLYIQFIVDARNGRMRGAESLSRWQNPEDGLLTPTHYIEQLKTAGIIDLLDFYIFEESCRQLEEWSGKNELWLSCNFTRVTVSHVDFLQRFEEIINRYKFNHKKLVIELTEDSLADNQAVAYQNVLACKKMGFQIALDDLGSGYTSFSDLCDYPIDMIKIDRHIVAKSASERGNALLHGITELAHNLGILVLCEGVETEKEDKNAKSAGCDYIQGYHYSRVLPQEEAFAFIEAIKEN